MEMTWCAIVVTIKQQGATLRAVERTDVGVAWGTDSK